MEGLAERAMVHKLACELTRNSLLSQYFTRVKFSEEDATLQLRTPNASRVIMYFENMEKGFSGMVLDYIVSNVMYLALKLQGASSNSNADLRSRLVSSIDDTFEASRKGSVASVVQYVGVLVNIARTSGSNRRG